MKKELRIIDTGNKYGNINLNPKFFPKNFTKEQVLKQFNLSRESIGIEYGFDGHKLYVADQIKDDGSYFEITEEYVEAYPEGWTDIPEDILVMSDRVDDAAIGHPVADCPVVIAHDKRQRVISIGHCGTYHTDKMLPVSIIDALSKSHNSKDEDIEVYVTAGAEKESYKKIKYPNYLTNLKVWNDHIYKGKYGLYHIDLKGAIKKQLIDRNIKEENIHISNIDTITNPNFYSHYATNHGHKEKAGNNFAGATFSSKILKK